MEPESKSNDGVRSLTIHVSMQHDISYTYPLCTYQKQDAFKPIGTSVLDEIVHDQDTGEENDGLEVFKEEAHWLIKDPSGNHKERRNKQSDLQRRRDRNIDATSSHEFIFLLTNSLSRNPPQVHLVFHGKRNRADMFSGTIKDNIKFQEGGCVGLSN